MDERNTSGKTFLDTTDNRPNVLITFLGYDRDDWGFRQHDQTFLARHRPGLPEAERDRPLTRHDVWRPAVALASQPALRFSVYHLLHDGRPEHAALLAEVKADIENATPDIQIVEHVEPFDVTDGDPCADGPWRLRTVYSYLYKLFKEPDFQKSEMHYYVNCSSGTANMCTSLFLLVQQGRILADRIRPYAWNDVKRHDYYTAAGSCVIDTPAEFDDVYRELARTDTPDVTDLDDGIDTRNPTYRKLLRDLRDIATYTREPILLTGPTGCGKTFLARLITTKFRKLHEAHFIARNCATFAGEEGLAKSELFGHSKDAFTGATCEKHGVLERANKGVLFLDEVGDLPLQTQGMLLTALEDAATVGFPRFGDGRLVKSNFQLVCGTNRDLWKLVRAGRFRRDLLERINLWHFDVPGLKDRREDIPSYALQVLQDFGRKYDRRMMFATDAESRFAEYSNDPDNLWDGNFRELRAMIFRMATLAMISNSDRITREVVEHEIQNVKARRRRARADDAGL